MAGNLLITSVRPMGGPSTGVLIRDGLIAAMGEGLSAGDGEILDGGDRLLLPGLVEAHTHLDKTMWGMPWVPHAAGPRLIDKIETERRLRRELDIDPERQSERQVRQAVSLGTTTIRSHVDIDTEIGLSGIEGVMRMRERCAGLADIQIVAFPQSGLLIRPGTLDLLREAMVMGADIVGGLDPAGIDRDPKGHLDAVFGLAEHFGKPLDIHLHEPAELGGFTLELIIERVKALSMQGRVMVSHAFCLGMTDRDYARGLIDQLARERIAVVTTGAPSRPVPPVRECVDAGMVVCGGSDGIRDCWNPYGNADMLERAMLIGLRNNFRRDDEIELALAACTTLGRTALGLEGGSVAVGAAADLVLTVGATPAEAVVNRPPDRTVIKSGRVVVRDGRIV